MDGMPVMSRAHVLTACVLAASCLIASVARAHTQAATADPDEGTLSSVRPRIPEPMLFDLVRPLGAARGEFEVNSLFRLTPAVGGGVRWAPEVEYAFAPGYGVEFELPIDGRAVSSVKAALQGTLPGPRPRTFIHGWQGIWEGERHGGGRQIDLLYLAGSRWHRRWSAFTVTGVRQVAHGARSRALLGNASLFYHAGKETSFGIETNLASAGASRVTVMPQLLTRRSRYNVQGGAGLVRESGRTRLQVAWRLSREL